MANKKRCAVYTRKSVEDGLEQEFNSLDAQRLAGENYIASQAANGWVCLPERYDDGGFSGGNLERPALQRLLKDAEAGLVDIIVIYKIDRLSRSLLDFSELTKKFDDWSVGFVAVTQEINTSTSSGRMMLNILMTFAQFERETIAERIRDKMSASRKRGKWVGGTIPFGYRVENKHLLPDPDRGHIVPEIFKRFCQCGSPRVVAAELNDKGIKTRQGKTWATSNVYRILNNHTYIGEVNYKGEIYPGEHQALIERELWNTVQELLKNNAPVERGKIGQSRYAPLKGLLRCGHCDSSMGPAYSKRRGKQYCYYICLKDTKRALSTCPVKRLAAGDIERAVVEQIGILFRTPSFVAMVANKLDEDVGAIMDVFRDIDGFWEELFPVERNRMFGLLIDHINVYEDGLEIKIKTAGMRGLINEVINVQD